VLSWFSCVPILLAALAVGCREAPPATRELTLWRPIGSWSGGGLVQTEAFIGETGAFRIRWRAFNESSPDSGVFRIVLHSSVSGRPLLTVLEHRGTGAGEQHVTEDPREFFLVMEAAGIEWSVSVDEAVRASGPAAGNR